MTDIYSKSHNQFAPHTSLNLRVENGVVTAEFLTNPYADIVIRFPSAEFGYLGKSVDDIKADGFKKCFYEVW